MIIICRGQGQGYIASQFMGCMHNIIYKAANIYGMCLINYHNIEYNPVYYMSLYLCDSHSNNEQQQ